MNGLRSSFTCSWLTRFTLSLVVLMGLASASFADQFDAPFEQAHEKHKAAWSEEDKPFFIYWASNANSPAGSPQNARFS